jgi:uncharacterized damage-inducible protein DinB
MCRHLLRKTEQMKNINSNTLLENLQAGVRNLLVQTGQLSQQPDALLETQPASGSWSVAQVLEHLNIYSRYYITAIEAKLHMHQTQPANTFRPGYLGNYFTTLMQPSPDDTIKSKMKAPRSAIPSVQPDVKLMLSEFTAHQHQLLQILQIARSANLQSIRIPTSISKWIRLPLGDTFRFFIAHQERHFVQIKNILGTLNTVQ